MHICVKVTWTWSCVCICNCIKCTGYMCKRLTAKISEKYAYRLELFYNSSLIEMFRVHFLLSHSLSVSVSIFLVGWSFAVGTMYAWVGQWVFSPLSLASCLPLFSAFPFYSLFSSIFVLKYVPQFRLAVCTLHTAYTHWAGGWVSENFCLIL